MTRPPPDLSREGREMLDWHGHADAAALIERLTADVLAALRDGLEHHGTASLIVSGGRTPGPLFDALAQAGDIDWPAVTVTLADERWLPESDPDSNAGLLRARLLTGAAAGASFIPLYGGEADPWEGEAAADDRLVLLPSPVDFCLLGMGDDGHTASLFPGAADLRRALTADDETCVGIDPPGAPHKRMTLTLAALLRSRRIALMVTGDSKRAVLETAIAGDDVEAMPVRAILRQDRVPVDIHWSP